MTGRGQKAEGSWRRKEATARPRGSTGGSAGSAGAKPGARRDGLRDPEDRPGLPARWGDGREVSAADRALWASTPRPGTRGTRPWPGRGLTAAEARAVRRMIAGAGFDPNDARPVPKSLDGVWDGETYLRAGQKRPTARLHYARHMVLGQQWPEGTPYEEYLRSIRDIAGDRHSVLFSRGTFNRNLRVYAMRRSGAHGGPAFYKKAASWFVVVYDVQKGSWLTGFQRVEGPEEVYGDMDEKERQWLDDGQR